MFENSIFIFLGQIFICEITGLYDRFMLTYLRNCENVSKIITLYYTSICIQLGLAVAFILNASQRLQWHRLCQFLYCHYWEVTETLGGGVGGRSLGHCHWRHVFKQNACLVFNFFLLSCSASSSIHDVLPCYRRSWPGAYKTVIQNKPFPLPGLIFLRCLLQ